MAESGYESTHYGPDRVIFDIVWEAEWPGFCQDIDDSMLIVFDPIDRESAWEFVPQPGHTHAATVTIGQFEAKYFCTLDLDNSKITRVTLIAMNDDMSLQVYGDVDCPVLGGGCPLQNRDDDLDRTCFDFVPYQDPNGNFYLELEVAFHLNHHLPEGLLIWASRRISARRVDFGRDERYRLNELLEKDIRMLLRRRGHDEREQKLRARDRRNLERLQENQERCLRNLDRRQRDLDSSDESYYSESPYSTEQSTSDELSDSP